MPKFAALQASFSGGEFAPVVYGRVDSERYKTGLQTCLNYFPTLQGPMIRRPGTKYVNNVKDSANPPALIPFKFNETQAYILEFGQNYIRFYTNGGQVITNSNSFKLQGFDNYTLLFNFFATRATNPHGNVGEITTSSSLVAAGSVLELKSPYNQVDVANIKFAQNADTIYLTHPAYAVYKLQRQGLYDWEIKQVPFQDGPYLNYNSYATTGDYPFVELNPSNNTFAINSSSINISTGLALPVANAVSSGATGFVRLTAPNVSLNFKTGDYVVVQGIAGTVEANNQVYPGIASAVSWQIAVVSSSQMDLIGSVFVHSYTGSGVIYPALFKNALGNSGLPADVNRGIALIGSGAIRYWGYITNVFDPAHIAVQLGQTSPNLPNFNTITSWQLSTWIQIDGSAAVTPSACSFHQNRLAFAGTPNFPQEVDLSQSNLFEGFAPSSPADLSVSDNNALQFNLNSKDLNLVKWMSSTAQGLLAGTVTSEWAITPSTQAAALTPTNFNAQQTSYFGSANADVAQAGNATLYIQRAQRRLRELNYFFQVGTFRSTDLTELAEHISIPTITKITLQRETQPLIWALRSDGILLSMTYNRDDLTLKAGWARHQLGGQSDSGGTNPKVLSMGVIPSSDISFDQLWMVVQRSTVSGSTFVSIEYMTKPFDDSILQEDAFQGDCGVTFDNPQVITGLVQSSGIIYVTCPGASLAVPNGGTIKITGINGLNITTKDINGNVSNSNLLNEKTFVVGSNSFPKFALLDFNSNPVVFGSSSAYVSGGQVRQLVSTISGLTWLPGETVGVLADGGIHPDVVVSGSGAITLQYPAAKVQIGYRYNSDAQTLRTEGGSADGTSIGALRRVHRYAFMLHNIGDLNVGPDFTDLLPISFDTADQQLADNAVPLFSGIYQDGVADSYDFDDFFCFRQSSMLPGMIQSLSLFLEEFDV